ncbi:MAG TPA: PPOX class F420-dependent oxidoreductase [Pseudonocardiaceae bacterium]|jgi:PPOX class probable F420-dependent enzyme|nr:PPOX class F420-dependent oxidoreductase [Pseudonocardiaceae bacterium]
MTVFHDPLRAGRPSDAARHAATEILAGPHLAVLSTVNPDGAPQSSVIFVKPDGDDILFSTINGRRKTTNMRRDPRVTLLLHALPDAEAESAYATISGTVTITDDPDSSFHQVMYDLHMDGAIPPAEPGAERLIVRLSPDRTYAPPPYIAE